MDLEKLRDASDALHDASDATSGDVAERLATQADALADLADGDRGPDHGQVARHQEKLREIKAEAPSIADQVEAAYQFLNDYRETVEGV